MSEFTYQNIINQIHQDFKQLVHLMIALHDRFNTALKQKQIMQIENKITKIIHQLILPKNVTLNHNPDKRTFNNTVSHLDFHGMKFNFGKYRDDVLYYCLLAHNAVK